MRVLHNGVNLDQFQPDVIAAKQNREEARPGDDPVLLFVGRVCEQKGTDILHRRVHSASRTRSESSPGGRRPCRTVRGTPDHRPWWSESAPQAACIWARG